MDQKRRELNLAFSLCAPVVQGRIFFAENLRKRENETTMLALTLRTGSTPQSFFEASKSSDPNQ
jgi:hypothetical protein